jgi:hypothetical protein
MKGSTRLAGLLLLMPMLGTTACRDEVQPPILNGAYVATEAVAGTTELIEAGYTLAYHFIFGVAPLYQVVLVPPDHMVVQGQAAVGFFDVVGNRIAFYDADANLRGIAEAQQTGNTVRLDYTLPMIVNSARLSATTGLSAMQLIGLGQLTASSLTFRNAAGDEVELIGAGGSATLTFGEQGYHLRITVPEGVFGPNQMVLDWPGFFATVGPTVLLQSAFGCVLYGARMQYSTSGVSFQGVGCNIAGQARHVNAVFQTP